MHVENKWFRESVMHPSVIKYETKTDYCELCGVIIRPTTSGTYASNRCDECNDGVLRT